MNCALRHITLFLFLSCLVFTISAQTITVVSGKDTKPIAGAHIAIQSISGKSEGMILITEKNGQARLSSTSINGRYIVVISHLNYEKFTDTTELNTDKTYQLNPSDVSLDEVVITAQYTPQSADKSVHKVHVITGEKIEKMAAVNLEDVLSNEMNIRLSQDNILGSGMSMQGISGENVKIMIDGVPVIGRQNGNIDLTQINLNDVERIEVVEGPLSVNYGTNALAGTINIITKKSSESKVESSVTSYTENIGTYNLSAAAALNINKSRISLSGGRNYFDGWNNYDEFWPTFEDPIADTTRRQQWKPRKQHYGRLQYNYRFKDLTLGYKGEVFDEKITNRGYPRPPYQESAFDDYYYTYRLDNGIYANGAISKNKNINLVASYNYYRRVKNTYIKDLTTTDEQLTSTQGDQDTTRFALWMSRGSFNTSKEAVFNYELGYEVSYETAYGDRIEDGEKDQGDYALFATSEIRPFLKSEGDKNWGLTLFPGIRVAYNTVYDAPPLPSLNLKFHRGSFTYRLSYARGFRAPSLKEIYFNFVDINHNIVGNPDLKAENSNNFSFSVVHKRLSNKTLFQAELSTFYNDINNLISLAQTSGTAYSYVNIGEYKTTGANLKLTLVPKDFRINIGGGVVGRYNQLSDSTLGKPFNFYPELMSNIQYMIPWLKATFALYYKYQGRLPGYALNTEGEVLQTFIDDYHLLDANISKDLWKNRVSVAIGCKNITDVRNVNSSVSGGAHSGSSNSIPVATGRLLFVRLKLQFVK